MLQQEWGNVTEEEGLERLLGLDRSYILQLEYSWAGNMDSCTVPPALRRSMVPEDGSILLLTGLQSSHQPSFSIWTSVAICSQGLLSEGPRMAAASQAWGSLPHSSPLPSRWVGEVGLTDSVSSDCTLALP